MNWIKNAIQWLIDNQVFLLAVLGFAVGAYWKVRKIWMDYQLSQADSFWAYLLDKGEDYLKELAAEARREITKDDVFLAAGMVWDMVPETVTGFVEGVLGFGQEEFAALLWQRWQDYVEANAGMVRAGLIAPG